MIEQELHSQPQTSFGRRTIIGDSGSHDFSGGFVFTFIKITVGQDNLYLIFADAMDNVYMYKFEGGK